MTSSLRLALVGLAATSVAAGIAAVALVLSSDHVEDRGAVAAPDGRLELLSPPGGGTCVS